MKAFEKYGKVWSKVTDLIGKNFETEPIDNLILKQ